MFDNVNPVTPRVPSEQTKKAMFDFLLGKSKGSWIKTSGNQNQPSSPGGMFSTLSKLGETQANNIGNAGKNLFGWLREGMGSSPRYRSPNMSLAPSNYSQSLGSLPRNYQLLVKNGVSRPHRNNNPLNIKESQHTRGYTGVVGRDPYPAADSGHFLIFDTVQSGFNAAKRLLSTDGYINKTVDAAMRRWSNNGYGGEILPSIKNKPIASLSRSEFDLLVKAMARREGFGS